MVTSKKARGTKRSCQNADCGSRFYDLNRDPITCPICDAAYVIAVAAPPPRAKTQPAPVKKEPEAAAETEKADKADKADKDDADLADIEVADDSDDDDADDTFLETEEDEEGADVSGIIGKPATKKEDET